MALTLSSKDAATWKTYKISEGSNRSHSIIYNLEFFKSFLHAEYLLLVEGNPAIHFFCHFLQFSHPLLQLPTFLQTYIWISGLSLSLALAVDSAFSWLSSKSHFYDNSLDLSSRPLILEAMRLQWDRFYSEISVSSSTPLLSFSIYSLFSSTVCSAEAISSSRKLCFFWARLRLFISNATLPFSYSFLSFYEP